MQAWEIVWGPNARATIQKIPDEPEAGTHESFPFAALRNLKIKGVPVLTFLISYVGEQGWELHFQHEDGLASWDALYALGVTKPTPTAAVNGCQEPLLSGFESAVLSPGCWWLW